MANGIVFTFTLVNATTKQTAISNQLEITQVTAKTQKHFWLHSNERRQ